MFILTIIIFLLQPVRFIFISKSMTDKCFNIDQDKDLYINTGTTNHSHQTYNIQKNKKTIPDYSNIPFEFRDDPELYYAIQASLNEATKFEGQDDLIGWDQSEPEVAWTNTDKLRQKTPSTGITLSSCYGFYS